MKRYLFALLLPLFVSHETFAIGKRWNLSFEASEVDSIRTKFDKNGVNAYSGVKTSSFDTTFVYFNVPDTFYQLYSFVYYQGTTYPAISIWEFGRGAINNNYKLHAYFQDSAVICTLIVKTDGITTGTANKSGIYSWDTTITVTQAHVYEAIFKPRFVGNDSSSVMTFTRNTDSADVVAGIPQPSDTFHTTVWGFVQDASSNAVPNARVTFSLVKSVNNMCDSVLVVDPEVDCLSDDSGYFQIELIRSYCLDSTKYKAQAKWRTGQTKTFNFLVPDTVSYHLVWP